MENLERYLLWGAIIVLFILFFWPKASGYRGEPNSLMRLAEFEYLSDDIKRVYNDTVLKGLQNTMQNVNEKWKRMSLDDKNMLQTRLKSQIDDVSRIITMPTMSSMEKTPSPSPTPAPQNIQEDRRQKQEDRRREDETAHGVSPGPSKSSVSRYMAEYY